MAHIAADDDVCGASGSKRQIPVVIRILTFDHGFGRLDAIGCQKDDVQDPAPMLDRDEAVELGTEQYVPVFLFNGQ